MTQRNPGQARRAAMTLAMAALVHDRHPRLAVVEPVLERLGAEQHRQRHRHRAELVDRHVRDRRFEALRQQNRDPVAPLHAELFAIPARGDRH